MGADKDDLSALLDLYKNTRTEIIEREKSENAIPLSYYTVAIGIITIVFTIAKISGLVDTNSSSLSTLGTWAFLLPCLVVPILSLTGYYQFTMHSRTVAVLQGYGAYLETRINACLSQPAALHYSQYINRFLIGDKFKTNQLSFILLIPILLAANLAALCFPVFSLPLFSSPKTWPQGLVFCLVWLVCIYGTIVLVIDNVYNDDVRGEAANPSPTATPKKPHSRFFAFFH